MVQRYLTNNYEQSTITVSQFACVIENRFSRKDIYTDYYVNQRFRPVNDLRGSVEIQIGIRISVTTNQSLKGNIH